MKVIGPYKRFFLRLDDGGKVEWFVTRWCVKAKWEGKWELTICSDKKEALQHAAYLRRAQ